MMFQLDAVNYDQFLIFFLSVSSYRCLSSCQDGWILSSFQNFARCTIFVEKEMRISLQTINCKENTCH